jgi:2'-5' RNA ligase
VDSGPVYCDADSCPKMEIESNGDVGINVYALVTYIPDPLGKFLDDVRRILSPGCNPRAHVTLMPPRPLSGTVDHSVQQIERCTQSLEAFELHATSIGVFPKTNVIYIEIGMGRDALLDIHRQLNHGPLAFREPYAFHPHITLAQEIPAGLVSASVEAAREMWASYRYGKTFMVEEMTFVQNTLLNHWKDLATVHLKRSPAHTF